MFFIFGVQPKTTVERTGSFQCPICQSQTTYQLRTQRSHLSLFFLPILPVGKPKAILQCLACYTVLPEKFLPEHTTQA